MIFVFGSNLQGIHGKGAAKTALEDYGARWGQGFGRQGHSYAIPTKATPRVRLPLIRIKIHVDAFLEYARLNPKESFYLTAIGTGLAGYTHNEIAPMFKGLSDNVQAPIEWLEYLYEEFK